MKQHVKINAKSAARVENLKKRVYFAKKTLEMRNGYAQAEYLISTKSKKLY
jgi:hypothetical protein